MIIEFTKLMESVHARIDFLISITIALAKVPFFEFKYLDCYFTCLNCNGLAATNCINCGDNTTYHRTLQSDFQCKCDKGYYEILD